jgi:ABC-type Mn2+/Zn2+ transport system permease subunit/Mn-dependent DtxR family transcriptional regulator
MRLLMPLAVRFEVEQDAWGLMRLFVTGLFDRRIDSIDLVVWAAILLGVTCGVLGTFIVLRRQSLLGDAIGHSVLPGVCIGFLAAGTKSMPALMLGALIAGLLAAGLIGLLQRTTVLKAGECMGAVFTGFYAIGVMLLVHINKGASLLAWLGVERRVTTGQSGLETFLFGQIVGISFSEVTYMAVMAAMSLLLVAMFWRMLAVASFDESFAATVGVPVRRVHYLLMVLLTVAIVISIQAVGVVLVAAMLITPAAAAYLLTDRLSRMVVLSAAFGAAAGVAGVFFSLLLTRPGRDLPTGASMVLAASAIFGLAFLFSRRYGVVPRLLRLWKRGRRTQAENLIRTLYLMWEDRPADDRRFGVHDIAAKRQESPGHVRRLARLAMKRGWVDRGSLDPLILTEEGLAEARRVVRNHRLWELFLTQEAHLAHDHVHADAEYIEHVLPRDVVRRLEAMLETRRDPHGRAIP